MATDRKPKPDVGVGSPAYIRLLRWGNELDAAFDSPPFLVGSAARGKHWRDVDVRIILDDARFAEMFGTATRGGVPWEFHPLWMTLCTALSLYGREATGLPIDFQFQPQSHANELFDGVRIALILPARASTEDREGGEG